MTADGVLASMAVSLRDNRKDGVNVEKLIGPPQGGLRRGDAPHKVPG
jgi:hypothetical protein